MYGIVEGGGLVCCWWCVSEFSFGGFALPQPALNRSPCFSLGPSPLSGPPSAAIERMRSADSGGKLDLTLEEYESHNVMQMGTGRGVPDISLSSTCKFLVSFSLVFYCCTVL